MIQSPIVEIRQKIVGMGCYPDVVPLGVNPGSFPGNSPPASLTVSVGSVSPGTAAYVYIINPGQDAVVSSVGAPVGSDGTIQVSLPSSLPDGHYAVVAEFEGLGYAAQGGFDVRTDSGGGGGGDPCASPDTHDHSGSCGGTDSCGHSFGSDTDCGCPNAPIVYDTCYQTVCDQTEVWVDDWCDATRRVCDTETVTVDDWCDGTRRVCDTGERWVVDYCQGSQYVCDTGSQWITDYCDGTRTVCDYEEQCSWNCDDSGCWPECNYVPVNCRDETYSYACGGHWENYNYNCRWETYTYECGGHPETYEYNCRYETYQYVCGSHQETREVNCRDESYRYVCGGHWETVDTNCREEPYQCNPHQCR